MIAQRELVRADSPYRPLPLGSLCNAGLGALPPQRVPRLGYVPLRGIPFQFGEDPNRCYVGIRRSSNKPMRLAMGVKARLLIFAHALPLPDIGANEAPGLTVATYHVRYMDRTVLALHVRRRYEVGRFEAGGGGLAALAVLDEAPRLPPRRSVEWARAGMRASEVTFDPAAGVFWLWAWRNPRPDAPIDVIDIEPTENPLVLGAITLGTTDEDPFARTPSYSVRVALLRDVTEGDLDDIQFAVDRGSVTFPYALVEDAPATLPPGWGVARPQRIGAVHVSVQAAPSAVVAVQLGGERLASASWSQLIETGKIETASASIEILDQARNWVRTTVLDDSTGLPMPCRVRFTSKDGVPFPPEGHHAHVNGDAHGTTHLDVGGDLRLGHATYAYIDGRCEGWVPRGSVSVEAARGFEYEPMKENITVLPETREITIRLRRIANMNARHWFSGDSHVHFLGERGGHFEAAAEDLNVVNLLAAQWGHLRTNVEDFTGTPSVSSDGRTIVHVSQENRQAFLGHLVLWGLERPVYPLSGDGWPIGDHGSILEETLSGWADGAHAAGGTVILPHFPLPNGEPAVLAATGRADAIETVRQGMGEDDYYRYLSAGFRLPLVGGTDKMTNEVPVGLYRTYARVNGEFTFAAWTAAVRAGRTFASGGPLLALRVDGSDIGDTVRVAPGGSVEVEADVESIFAVNSLQLVVGGRVVAESADRAGARHLKLRERVRVDRDTWIAARCGGSNYRPDGLRHYDVWRRGIFAHTSPIYVTTADEWNAFDLDAARYMLANVEVALAYVQRSAAVPTPGTVTHRHGLSDHRAYLERPFHEARRVLQERIERGTGAR